MIGLHNPRPYTLRRLKQLADGKRQHDYDLIINQTVYISQMLTGKFKPQDANPYREPATVQRILRQQQMSEEERRDELKQSMQMLKIGLSQIPGATSG